MKEKKSVTVRLRNFENHKNKRGSGLPAAKVGPLGPGWIIQIKEH